MSGPESGCLSNVERVPNRQVSSPEMFARCAVKLLRSWQHGNRYEYAERMLVVRQELALLEQSEPRFPDLLLRQSVYADPARKPQRIN